VSSQHVVVAGPGGGSGFSAAAIVLLWIFVGWPLSWLLLFLFAPLGIIFGVAITIGMIVALAASSGGSSRSVVVNVAPPPPGPQQAAYAQDIRRQLESLATINAVGGCGWCGSPAAHVNDSGYHVHPRYWHASEIEERVRAKLLR
jgi:hypothetical protein